MELKDKEETSDRGLDRELSNTWSRSKSIVGYSLPGGMSSIDKANARKVHEQLKVSAQIFAQETPPGSDTER